MGILAIVVFIVLFVDMVKGIIESVNCITKGEC